MPYLFTNELERPTSKPFTIVKSAHDPSVTSSPAQEIKISGSEPTEDEKAISIYPIVKLETDTITDTTAARLATSLLGHILFLKNQVPFPVLQLSRLPGGKTTNARAAKQRAELLASFDTISSHFDTTFTSLSTAFARCSSASISASPHAHLAFLIGPSLTSAKAKIILGVDGLHLSIWGSRTSNSESEDGDSEVESEEDQEDCEHEDGDDEAPEDSEDDENDDCEDEHDASDDEIENKQDGSEESDEEDESDNHEDQNSERVADNASNAIAHQLTPPRSYAEEQKFLQTADRLLSRTLAAADADGHGILSEMAPTQTHVLLHAPRRFNHPAWIPRQNVGSSLDRALQEFMVNSGLEDAGTMPVSKPLKKNRVEGVWITTKSGLQPAQPLSRGKDDPKITEDDEMIWWSWDGKLVGFADW